MICYKSDINVKRYVPKWKVSRNTKTASAKAVSHTPLYCGDSVHHFSDLDVFFRNLNW